MVGEKRFHFFALLSRMKYIARWGLMRNTQSENIQEHSLQVGVIAHALGLINNKYFGGNINSDRIAVLGMYHDCNEIITGDLPTPVKYHNPAIKKAYKEIEEVSKNKLISLLPDELAKEYKSILFHEENSDSYEAKIVKAADRISAYIKCVEEAKAGNTEFKKASESIYNDIVNLKMPEVDYFLNNFMASFFLSLDELD